MLKKITKIKLHDHTCPENWIKVEKKINKVIELLEEVKKKQDGRKCERCGHTNSEGAIFCNSCQDDLDTQ